MQKSINDYKQEAINNVTALLNKLNTNPEKEEYIKNDVLARLNDEERFSRYVALKKMHENRTKQSDLLNEMIDANPKFSACKRGAFERCFYFYLKTENTPEAKKYNQEIAEKYCTVEGRTEMIKEAIQDFMNMNPQEILANAGEASKMSMQVVENPAFFEKAFLAMKICDSPEFKLSPEVTNFLEKQRPFFESLNGYIQASKVLGSELNFLMENEDKFLDITSASMVNQKLALPKEDRLYQAAEAFVTAKFNIDDLKSLKDNMKQHPDVDFNKPLYQIKSTNKDGQEIGIADALTKKDVTFSNRTNEELSKVNPDNLTSAVDFAKEKCSNLLDLAVLHNNKKKPGFFSRLFNTKYNKTYKKEIKDIDSLKDEIKGLGVSEENIKDISNAKTKTDDALYNAVFDIKSNLLEKDFGYKVVNEKEPVEVDNANNVDKQTKVKENEREMVKVIENDKTKEL